MGIRDWRARHALKDPVTGQFQVTGRYFAHPNGSSYREMLTGVVTGPGIAATAGEHLDDTAGRYVGHDVLPALIDRSDPSRFVVLWDEIPKPDFRADARAEAQRAAEAARHNSAAPTAHNLPTHDSSGATPSWANDLVADLARQGLIPGITADDMTAGGASAPIIVTLPEHVIDLTAGHVSAGDAAHLMTTGVPATAVLTAIGDVPVPQQALPGPTASLCDLTLQVTPAGEDTYATQTRLGFRDAHRRAMIAVIGATLPVRIDPNDRTRVVVDTTTYDAQHPDLTKRPTNP